MSEPSATAPSRVAERTFRLPRSTYLIVLFLFFGAVPLAFTDNGIYQSRATLGPQTLVLLVPIGAALFIARTRTTVGDTGITVRALFGTRRLSWPQVRGLSVQQRSVYAVGADGAVRLPCVRVGDLAAVAKASGGRLPEVAEPAPKFAPSKRRR